MSVKRIGSVKFRLNPKNPPKMTAKQMTRLREMKEESIDLSDAPASPRDAVWTRPDALVSVENKKQITVRLDADVLEFFRKTGSRYQSRINAALREYMKAHERAS
jgi:uncharacterized protein (DUF4415 family)